jgi:acyl-CoA thioesterase I
MKSLLLAALTFLGCAQPPAPAAPLDGGAPPAIGDGGGAAPQRYLALGDSFTIGTGGTPARSMPTRLADRWEAAGCPTVVKNLGVNGYATDDLITYELPQVRPFAPTRLTLAVGANDIVRGSTPEEYRARVREILAALVADGIAPARIFVLPQPEWSSSPAAQGLGDEADLFAQITLFNRILSEEATASGARWVDLTARMHQQALANMLASDLLHPNADAYGEWAADIAALGTPCDGG